MFGANFNRKYRQMNILKVTIEHASI